MRSVRPDGVGSDWNATVWIAAGFGLAAVGGFFGSLFKEREVLAAARRSALASSTAVNPGVPAVMWHAVVTVPEGESAVQPAEVRA